MCDNSNSNKGSSAHVACTFLNSGLGHRFTEMVFSMVLADRINATFVFDDKCWDRPGDHGSYDWFNDFFPIHETEITISDVEKAERTLNTNLMIESDNQEWDEVVNQSEHAFQNHCSTAFGLDTHHSFMERLWAYEQVKWRLRSIYARSRWQPSVDLFNQEALGGSLSVAWHTRSGDIVLNNSSDYYQNVASLLTSLLVGIPHKVFFFGQNVTQVFPFLPELCESEFPHACSFPDASIPDTMHHLIVADVLVTSGSSFASIAAMFRETKPTLAAVPKDGVRDIYDTSENIFIDERGNFQERDGVSFHDIRAQIRLLYHRKTLGFQSWMVLARRRQQMAGLVLSNQHKNSVDRVKFSNYTDRKQILLMNMTCYRFSVGACFGGAGLGHRFSEMVFGMVLADKTNTTFLFDEQCWERSGKHGSYSWFNDFFPMQETEITFADIKQVERTLNTTGLLKDVYATAWDDVVNQSKIKFEDDCNVMFRADTGSSFMQRRGAYEQVKWRMRSIHAKSTWQPFVNLFSRDHLESSLSVAWHMRSGDIILNNFTDYYRNVASILTTLLVGVPYEVYFFGQNVTQAFPFIPDICRTHFSNACSFPAASLPDTMHHLIVADILVTSGSSFASIAARSGITNRLWRRSAKTE